jgi:hypothetical protein
MNRHRMPYYLELIKKYGFEISYRHTKSTEQETRRFGLQKGFTKYSETENRAIYLEFITQKI